MDDIELATTVPKWIGMLRSSLASLSIATKFRLGNILYRKQNELAEMISYWEAKAIKRW